MTAAECDSLGAFKPRDGTSVLEFDTYWLCSVCGLRGNLCGFLLCAGTALDAVLSKCTGLGNGLSARKAVGQRGEGDVRAEKCTQHFSKR